MSSRPLSGISQQERETIERWQFWIAQVSATLKDRKAIGDRLISWAFASEAEGLVVAPPWLVLLLGLSLYKDLYGDGLGAVSYRDREGLKQLLSSPHLTFEARSILVDVYETWILKLEKRADWRLARRHLLILTPQLHSRLVGLCLNELISVQNVCQQIEADQLDISSIKLVQQSLETIDDDLELSIDEIQERGLIESRRLIIQGGFLLAQLRMPKDFSRLVLSFEALHTPARRILFRRLEEGLSSLRLRQAPLLSSSQHRRSSSPKLRGERVASTGALCALTRSGQMNHLAQSEWSYLSEDMSTESEATRTHDLFSIKWALGELLYYRRELLSQDHRSTKIHWQFREISGLLSSSIDGLSILAWAQLISESVSSTLASSLDHPPTTQNTIRFEWEWSEERLSQQDQLNYEEERSVFELLRETSPSHPRGLELDHLPHAKADHERSYLSAQILVEWRWSTHERLVSERAHFTHLPRPSSSPLSLRVRNSTPTILIFLSDQGTWSMQLSSYEGKSFEQSLSVGEAALIELGELITHTLVRWIAYLS